MAHLAIEDAIRFIWPGDGETTGWAPDKNSGDEDDDEDKETKEVQRRVKAARKTTASAHATTAAAAAGAPAPQKVRMCRACHVPLKGHKGCPARKPRKRKAKDIESAKVGKRNDEGEDEEESDEGVTDEASDEEETVTV